MKKKKKKDIPIIKFFSFHRAQVRLILPRKLLLSSVLLVQLAIDRCNNLCCNLWITLVPILFNASLSTKTWRQRDHAPCSFVWCHFAAALFLLLSISCSDRVRWCHVRRPTRSFPRIILKKNERSSTFLLSSSLSLVSLSISWKDKKEKKNSTFSYRSREGFFSIAPIKKKKQSVSQTEYADLQNKYDSHVFTINCNLSSHMRHKRNDRCVV